MSDRSSEGWQDVLKGAHARMFLARFWAKCIPEPNTGCLLWVAGANKAGYGQFGIVNPADSSERWTVSAHRLSHWLATGELPPVVRHRCDTPSCIASEHLLGGTQRENMEDMDSRGRRVRGETQGGSRLTEDGVRIIRTLLAAGRRQVDVAARFDVSQVAISDVAVGKTWSHVA